MKTVHPSQDRGCFDHGWLQTCHTFSFGDYQDPAHMRFRVLRVMNEDHIAPGQGFGMHSHRDMEIVTYVLEGSLEHKDSLGSGEVLRAGELQRMTAGSGIQHSEFNPSQTEPVHLYQIWLLPERKGLPPEYEQREFAAADRRGRWQLVASPSGAEGSLKIHQDAQLYLADPGPGDSLPYSFAAGRHGWLQILRGSVNCGGEELIAGDGMSFSDEVDITVSASEPAEVLLFDLP